MEFMLRLRPFCREFRGFCSSIGISRRAGETFAAIVPAAKFYLVEGALFAPIHHILFEIDDEDDEHEENFQVDEDKFGDDKG